MKETPEKKLRIQIRDPGNCPTNTQATPVIPHGLAHDHLSVIIYTSFLFDLCNARINLSNHKTILKQR